MDVEIIKETTESMKVMFKDELKTFAKRRLTLEENYTKIFAVTWGSCSPALQSDLISTKDYEEKKKNNDALWLLKTLRKITLGLSDKRSMVYNAFTAVRSLYTSRQQNNESLEEYHKKITATVNTVEFMKTSAFVHEYIVDTLKKENSYKQLTNEKVEEKAKEKYKAMVLLMNANVTKYKSLWIKLEQNLSLGRDEYPNTVVDCLDILAKHNPPILSHIPHPGRGRGCGREAGGRGLSSECSHYSFTQARGVQGNTNDVIVSGTDGNRHPYLRCYRCQHMGHIDIFCPSNNIQATQFVLSVSHEANLLPSSWLLLDSCSSISSMKTMSFVKHIKQVEPITTYSNGGTMNYSWKGVFSFLPSCPAYYNKESLANKLSLSDVMEKYKVTMNSEIEHSIQVHLEKGQIMRFAQVGNGIFACDLSGPDCDVSKYDTSHMTLTPSTPHVCALTVGRQQLKYSVPELKRADKAFDVQGRLGYVSKQQMKRALDAGVIINAPFTSIDLEAAHTIYGSPVPFIKGTSTRQRPNPTETQQSISIPMEVEEQVRSELVDMDHCKCNGNTYFHTKGRKVRF
mmetsp:Transcript_1239/g.1758  ORF Transcript_1239/g.1758 Transcript_1239/m.1758 type:complete len:570 (-) Transcript_1239:3022-4731(-)